MATSKAGKTPAPPSKAKKVAVKVASSKPVARKAAPKKPAVRKKPVSPAVPINPFRIDGREWNRVLVATVVCNAIASSSKSITTILGNGFEGHALPDYATFARWMAPNADGSSSATCDLYARAKEAQADFMAEELAEIHEKAWVPICDPSGVPLMKPNGQPFLGVDKNSAALVRLEADNKKWLMAKLKPKRYGDKLSTEHTGAGGGPIQARIAVEFVDPPGRAEGDE